MGRWRDNSLGSPGPIHPDTVAAVVSVGVGSPAVPPDPSPTTAQFPSLQSKMRVVLRVEVEAVKFLKEEPNRLDGLLKRCKTVTDTLAQIRR